MPQADVLVMETTFGRPNYVFAPQAETYADLGVCEGALAEGAVPVLLAYSLGKAQEVLMVLKDFGRPLMVHRTIGALNAVYRSRGSGLAGDPAA